MRLALFATLAGAAGLWTADDGKSVPVVVELFTSEGCSSCPPADALLTRLDQQQPVAGAQIIALSEHVDYWDRLGWKDPYSSSQFTERQLRYVQALRRPTSYTPQMVVDGQREFNGSDVRSALAAIAEAAQTRKAKVLASWNGSGPAEIRVEDLPAVARGETVEVLLAITESGLSSRVSRGENAGRRLAHIGVVRRLIVIGKADPAKAPAFAATLEVRLHPAWKRENLRAVAFVQERGSRRVLGAASS